MGSTGSIGTQTLDIIRSSGGQFTVQALGVGTSVDELVRQVDEFSPEVAVVADESKYADAKERIGTKAQVLVGDAGLAEASSQADVVINGVMGFAGLVCILLLLAGFIPITSDAAHAHPHECTRK